MAAVSWENASKRFGNAVALLDLSLTGTDGEFLVLVGPSGSGKTTALRLLAGLEALSAGHVRIGERIVDRLPPRDRDIAMVFQDYALYPQMTVFDNLAFGLRVARVPRREIRHRVGEAAGLLGLGDLLKRKPRELSGGQRQRVALGRAIVRHPQVFLMDEPLSNLDAKLRVQTRGEIKRLQAQLGTTTVYVTHDQVEAMTMGDRIAVMRDGVLEQVGDPDSVYSAPANVFVAGFIGSPAMTLNRLAATRNGETLELSRGEVCLRVPPCSVPLPGEVVVGVRPEHARLWTDGAGLLGPLQGYVEYTEALGRETFIGLSATDGMRFLVEAEGGVQVTLGETLRFGLKPGQLHLFDPESDRALARV
jgi:ABC-type sugar transport system ATPase subunit